MCIAYIIGCSLSFVKDLMVATTRNYIIWPNKRGGGTFLSSSLITCHTRHGHGVSHVGLVVNVGRHKHYMYKVAL